MRRVGPPVLVETPEESLLQLRASGPFQGIYTHKGWTKHQIYALVVLLNRLERVSKQVGSYDDIVMGKY